MPEPKFIPCMQDQPMLLPPDIGDLVPEGSMARVVDMIVRSIDRSTLTSPCPGGGAPKAMEAVFENETRLPGMDELRAHLLKAVRKNCARTLALL